MSGLISTADGSANSFLDAVSKTSEAIAQDITPDSPADLQGFGDFDPTLDHKADSQLLTLDHEVESGLSAMKRLVVADQADAALLCIDDIQIQQTRRRSVASRSLAAVRDRWDAAYAANNPAMSFAEVIAKIHNGTTTTGNSLKQLIAYVNALNTFFLDVQAMMKAQGDKINLDPEKLLHKVVEFSQFWQDAQIGAGLTREQADDLIAKTKNDILRIRPDSSNESKFEVVPTLDGLLRVTDILTSSEQVRKDLKEDLVSLIDGEMSENAPRRPGDYMPKGWRWFEIYRLPTYKKDLRGNMDSATLQAEALWMDDVKKKHETGMHLFLDGYALDNSTEQEFLKLVVSMIQTLANAAALSRLTANGLTCIGIPKGNFVQTIKEFSLTYKDSFFKP